jgi:hypothetical protein
VRDAVASTEPSEGFAGAIQGCRFHHVFGAEALAADGGALLSEDRGHSGLGDALAIADLLGGFASFVSIHDVGNVIGG